MPSLREAAVFLGGFVPSFVEAAIIHDLEALGTTTKEGVRALKLVRAGLALGQQVQIPKASSLLSFHGQGRVR